MRLGLLDQWKLKLLALLLAIVLWFFVASVQHTEVALAVPIEYVGLEGPLALAGRQPETVDVQLQTSRWAAGRVSPATVRVRVDVGALREGDNTVRLLPESVQVPPGVRVTRLTPAWATIHTIRAATRTVQVVARLQGRPAADHVVGPVAVDPATVEIKGPRTTIEGRTAIETLPVDVSGRRAPVTQTVGLALPDSVYPVDRRTVSVTVEIRPQATGQSRDPEARR